jgi:oligopeptide transport system permease protein
MYFLRRLAYMIPLLVIISAVLFGLELLTPGNPFDTEHAPASPQIRHNIEAKYHLNEPAWKQYLRYIGGVVHGDFGPSYKYRDHSVTDIVRQGLPVSMVLGLLAFGFAMGVGLPLGFITAVRRGRWQDHVGSIFALLAVCTPSFVIAPLLILAFTIKWKLLPVALWESPAHAVLPMIGLGLYFSGKVARLFREGMLNTMQMEFVTAARAKGVGENTLLLRHAVRLAILPVVSYVGPMLADLLTGSFVIESIFQIPGIGVFFTNSVLNHDVPMTIGLALLYATLVVGLNLMVDFAYMLLDPRVKYE